MTAPYKRPIVSLTSPISFDATIVRIWDFIAQEDLSIFTTFDYRRSGNAIDLDAPAQEVIVFGDPQLIAKAVRSAPLLGLELPLRMLVHETPSGETQISYYDPTELALEFEIEPRIRYVVNAIKRVAEAVTSADAKVTIF